MSRTVTNNSGALQSVPYYDPAGGRFTQSDPVGMAGGLNTYAYVGDPLTWVDPLGLTPCKPYIYFNKTH